MRAETRMPMDRAGRLLDRSRIMLLVLVCLLFLTMGLGLSRTNFVIANRVTGVIGSVASGIVGNKEAQSKLLQFELHLFHELRLTLW